MYNEYAFLNCFAAAAADGFSGIEFLFQIAGVPERHEPETEELNYLYLFRLIDELGYQD